MSRPHIVGIGLVRRDETVGSKILLGLWKTALDQGDIAELVVGDHPVGTDLQEPGKAFLGIFQAAVLPVVHGRDIENHGIVWILFEEGIESLRCFPAFPVFQHQGSFHQKALPRQELVEIRFSYFGQKTCGFFRILVSLGLGKAKLRDNKARIESKRLFQVLPGFFHVKFLRGVPGGFQLGKSLRGVTGPLPAAVRKHRQDPDQEDDNPGNKNKDPLFHSNSNPPTATSRPNHFPRSGSSGRNTFKSPPGFDREDDGAPLPDPAPAQGSLR